NGRKQKLKERLKEHIQEIEEDETEKNLDEEEADDINKIEEEGSDSDDKLSIEKRLNFEDLNFLLQWNKLQKIGKRFLKGSAKRLVTYKRGIQLLREFKTERDLNSALIHKKLTKRKRQANKTGR
ncbi:hypothetical protein ALC56_06673, partial [Trachymyrmex septentrionalis]